jgi:cytochrome b
MERAPLETRAMTTQRQALQEPTEIQVWDPFVRVAHWTIAIGFLTAYLTEDDLLTVHVWAGYIVGALVLLRVVWGFVGPRHARFADFMCGPRTAFAYLWDLLRFSARRYVGHSPAGGAMAVALLLFLAGTVASGLMLYAEDRGAGPLAQFYAQGSSTTSATPGAAKGDKDDGKEHRKPKSAFEDIHEVLANVTLVLVIIHILGVVLASFVHHENLARAMITGRKRRE